MHLAVNLIHNTVMYRVKNFICVVSIDAGARTNFLKYKKNLISYNRA